MRLAKAVGLTKEDVVLKADVPEIWLQRTKFWQKMRAGWNTPIGYPATPHVLNFNLEVYWASEAM